MVTPGVHPAQVEGQTDHIGPDEGYAESCVGGKVDHGDAREHATEAGDQPDRPHGHAEAMETLQRLPVLVCQDGAGRRRWRVRRPERWPERRCRVDAGAHRARWLRPSPRWERRASS